MFFAVDFDADIQNESNIRNASTLNTNKNTNVNNDFNEIESPEPSFTIHASKPYGFQNNAIFKKQVVKDDLLSDLMGIREKSLSMHPAVNMADSTSASSLNMDLFTQQDGLVRKCRDSSTYLLSRPVEKGNTLTSSHNDVLLYKDQLTCTVGNQSRYFLKYRKPISEKLISSGTLLTMPMAVLMEEAQEKEIQSRLAKEKVLKETEADMLDSKANLSRVPTKETNKLWVEKYAPKNFTQLLSVEKTNREVLKAVKAWDKFVFRSSVGDNKKTTSTGNDTAVTEHDNTSRKRERDDLSDDSDEEVIPMKEADKIVDLRPQHKVVMLCGPPGSGKTTLAHVIASHCGYNVIEVNASDDRSCAVLKDKITRSIQSNTINFNTNGNSLTGPGTATVVAEGGDGMPNCIILDEIDGIDNRDTVDMICNLIKAPLKQGKGKKKGESAVALTRPLICVCNDQYSPQLRELRKHSLVFNFNTPMETRLVQRLKQIMSLEGVELSTNVLMTLCDANGNDIRSCLNTLQFATLQSTQKVECEEKNAFEVNSARRKMMVSTTVHEMIKHGLKDEQKNAFQIWKIIFSLSDAASVTNPVDRSVNTFTSKPDRKCVIKNADIGTYLRSIIDEFGDMELLMHGIHENMLKVPYTDPCMSKTSNAMDWLSYTDQISPGHSGSGVHTIHYLAPACIAIHMLCSIDNRAKVEWPRKDRNAFLKKQESNSILQNLMDNSYALSRNRNSCLVSSKQVMVLDVVSHLVTIIHPRVRSHISNMYTLSPLEKYIFEGMGACVYMYCVLTLMFLAVSMYRNSKYYRFCRDDIY